VRGAPVILLLGPTATGKSEIAAAIARAVGGEIISADAFAVYRGFDIGTAKPSRALREEIPHHLIDVADPVEAYSAGRWGEEARRAILHLDSCGRVPIIAGGSHFYVRALLAGLPGGPVVSASLRSHFRGPWTPAARASRKKMVDVLDPVYSSGIPAADTARIARALEIIFSTGRRVSERRIDSPALGDRRLLKLALQFPRQALYTRIGERVTAMWRAGWPREVENLLAAGVPETAPAFRAIGYRELAECVAGRITEGDALARTVARTRALAKRQETWLASERGLERLEPGEAVRRAVQFVQESRA